MFSLAESVGNEKFYRVTVVSKFEIDAQAKNIGNNPRPSTRISSAVTKVTIPKIKVFRPSNEYGVVYSNPFVFALWLTGTMISGDGGRLLIQAASTSTATVST